MLRHILSHNQSSKNDVYHIIKKSIISEATSLALATSLFIFHFNLDEILRLRCTTLEDDIMVRNDERWMFYINLQTKQLNTAPKKVIKSANGMP